MIPDKKASNEDTPHGPSKADHTKTNLNYQRKNNLQTSTLKDQVKDSDKIQTKIKSDNLVEDNTKVIADEKKKETNGEMNENGEITTASGNRWRSIKSIFRREKRIAIFIDGPNLLRKIGKKHIKLEDVNAVAENLGEIRSKYIILNQYASNKLIEAMINSGYQPIVERSDIYVKLTLKIIEVVSNNKIDLLLVGSRDARVVPLLMKLKEKGIETAIVGFDPGFSVALKNVADYAFELT